MLHFALKGILGSSDGDCDVRCQVVNDDILSKYYRYYCAVALTYVQHNTSQKRLVEARVSIHTSSFDYRSHIFLLIDEL